MKYRSTHFIGRHRAALSAIALLLGSIVFTHDRAKAATDSGSYPAFVIKLTVPYPPGALTDLLARSLAERLKTPLNQPVVVENKPGAGTLVGAEYVKNQPADGYTLLMATSTTLGISPALYPKSPIDPIKDFTPVAMVGPVTFFLIATPDFPARDMQSFIAAVKAKPGQYNYGSVGNGSPHHLFMELLKTQTGIDAQHVPYKGTVAAIPDLLTGKIHFMFCDATVALPQIKAGKVIALGTSSARQTTLLPDVLPIANTVPGFDAQAWQGVVAPAGTPPEIVTKLNVELNKIINADDFRQQLTTFGMEANPMSAADFAALVRIDAQRWAKAVKDSGAKLD